MSFQLFEYRNIFFPWLLNSFLSICLIAKDQILQPIKVKLFPHIRINADFGSVSTSFFFRHCNKSRSFLVASFPFTTHWFIYQCHIYYLTQLFYTPLSSVYMIKKLLKPWSFIEKQERKHSFMDSFSSSCWSVASQSFGCILCSRIVIQVSFTTEMGCVCDKAGMFHSTYELIGLLSSPEAHLFSLHLGSSAFQYYELSAILYTLRSHKLQTSKAFPTIEARSWGNKVISKFAEVTSSPVFLQLFDYFCLSILYQKAYYILTTFVFCLFQGWVDSCSCFFCGAA